MSWSHLIDLVDVNPMVLPIANFNDWMSKPMQTRMEQQILRLFAVILTGILVVVPGRSFAQGPLLQKADKQITVKKYKAAVRTITKAMNSGELSDKQMARALYRRGVAFNGSGRYSSAIADLTRAIWLGKLESDKQKEAYRQRAKAYEATGFKKLARADYGRAGQAAGTIRHGAKRSPAIIPSAPPIPSFKTRVRAAKSAKPVTRPKVAAKPVAPKKAVIPAFRTSIATE